MLQQLRGPVTSQDELGSMELVICLIIYGLIKRPVGTAQLTTRTILQTG
jgi:hypothetical protein